MNSSDKYKHYTADDFANDEAFWLWVVEKDPGQIIFWTDFLNRNPAKKNEIEKAKQLVLLLNNSENNFSVARAKQLWHRIENTRISLQSEKPANKKTANKILSINQRQWLSVAAMISLLIISGALGWRLFYKPNFVTLATTYGQHKEFKLPDGSVVYLNANSNLKYKENWGTSQVREVWLDGEGYFNIQPKKNKQKFVVNAGNLYIKVLGTTFNVQHRRQQIKVVLRTGQISLGSEKVAIEPLLLKPGDLISYREQQGKFTKQIVDPEDYLTWKNNLLSFKDETLQNIFQLLQDNYNLNVIANDAAILEQKFTGTVPADDLSVLFMGLQEVHNLQITQNKDKVLVKRGLTR